MDRPRSQQQHLPLESNLMSGHPRPPRGYNSAVTAASAPHIKRQSLQQRTAMQHASYLEKQQMRDKELEQFRQSKLDMHNPTSTDSSLHSQNKHCNTVPSRREAVGTPRGSQLRHPQPVRYRSASVLSGGTPAAEQQDNTPVALMDIPSQGSCILTPSISVLPHTTCHSRMRSASLHQQTAQTQATVGQQNGEFEQSFVIPTSMDNFPGSVGQQRPYDVIPGTCIKRKIEEVEDTDEFAPVEDNEVTELPATKRSKIASTSKRRHNPRKAAPLSHGPQKVESFEHVENNHYNNYATGSLQTVETISQVRRFLSNDKFAEFLISPAVDVKSYLASEGEQLDQKGASRVKTSQEKYKQHESWEDWIDGY